MTYHHVNCTKCGRKIRAVDMAIDLDELIIIYLKREKEKIKKIIFMKRCLIFFSIYASDYIFLLII